MATGLPTREAVADPNAPDNGNAPAQQLSVGGVQGSRGAPAQTDTGLTDAIASLGAVSDTVTRKRKNAAFLDGQMASMAGKTQEEVAAMGNRTTMAGFVSLEVGNAVAEWQQAQTVSARTDHYNTSPKDYSAQLSTSAAELIAAMGGDEFAEEQLATALAPSMARLAATQATAHAEYTETETMNSYTTALILSGQTAAQEFDGSATTVGGPTNAAVTAGGDYRAFAQSISGQLIGVESGGNPNAKNPNSSAEGLGQFIDSTWISMINQYRPDLAEGKSRAELLAMKTDGPLSRQMSIEYSAELARGLAASGIDVTPGNTYLAYFSGPGGARRVHSADPNAPVSTSMTAAQIRANASIMYGSDGELITNAELIAWADRKMAGAPNSAANVHTSIMTNPGLPPEKHKSAVVGAIITSLSADDGSLYQGAGGLAGLTELNLSPAQIMAINNAHDGFQTRRQNEYNMDYERSRHNILTDAATGDFTEDEMFNRLQALNEEYDRTDAEMRRMQIEMQETITNQNQRDMLDVWDDPDRQLDLMQIRNDVLDGTTSVEDAMQDILDIGSMYGSDPEATEEAVKVIMGAYDKVRASERNEVQTTTAAGLRAAQVRANAAGLLGRNILGTGTKEEIEVGVALLEQTLIEDLMAQDLPPAELASKASEMMAKVLVQNDVVDPRRASMVRSAMHNPVGADGEVTEDAVEAMAFFLDLKHGANASPEYMTRMFAGNERTLELLLTAEGHMIGDADLDMAIQRAWDQQNSPVTQARITSTMAALDSGKLQEAVKEGIIDNSGLANTFWNNAMNTFNNNWFDERLDKEGVDRIMSDAGIDLVIEEEVRSAAALMPNASQDTITQVVLGQMADRGTIIGSSFVIAPKDSNMRTVMGLNSTETGAENEAVVRYIEEHGETMFGPAVWDDIKPSFFQPMNGDRGRPEFVVELVGDNMVIRPAASEYGDMTSIPEAAAAVIPARDIGRYYNGYQQRPTIIGTGLNAIFDAIRPADEPYEGLMGPIENVEIEGPPMPETMQ